MKVVINKCSGSFGLSDKAFERLIELGMTVTNYNKKGNPVNENADIIKCRPYGNYDFCSLDIDNVKLRTDKRVVQVVEELGTDANGDCCKLKIVDIPFNYIGDFIIEECEGIEWIAERHAIWE